MKPELLKSGDKIVIVAPSGRVFEKELTANLEFLKSLGLTPVLGENLFNDYYEGYHYAGTAEQRLSDFQSALDNDEIKAIWCARGGYGAVHLLDYLNWNKFLKNPKWIIGYSDITAIHNHVNNLGVSSLHGLTIKRLNTDYTPETFESLKLALFDGILNYKFPSSQFNINGKSKGKLIGGNLSLIYSLTGSISEIKGDNLILFIEDWQENWYHLDRMLINLKRSGLFDRILGLIVGSFTKMDVKDENPEYESPYDRVSNEIIHKFIKDYNIPVCFQFPAGHTGDNRALIMGSEVELEINNTTVKLDFI